MANRFRRKKDQEKNIAVERIRELFRQAENTKNQKLSNRYVELARKISSRTKTRIPVELKRKFCKHCGSYLRIGTNARVRLNKGKKSYFCMVCSHFTRIPYK